MSITKFSKDILIISSDIKDLNELSALQRKALPTVVNNLINRLTSLGFTNFKMLADSSLSYDIHEELINRGFSPLAFRAYPIEIVKEYSPLFHSKTYDFILNSESFFNSPADEALILKAYESNSGDKVKSGKPTKTISEREKIRLIGNLTVAIAIGLPTDYKSVKAMKSEIDAFAMSLGTTIEALNTKFSRNLDENWTWACEVMAKENLDDTANIQNKEKDVDDFLSTSTEKDVAKSAILALLRSKDDNDVDDLGATFNIQLDDEKIKEDIERIKLENEMSKLLDDSNIENEMGVNKDSMSLLKALTEIGEKEVLKDERLSGMYMKLLEDMDNFYDYCLRTLISESNLIVDLYANKSNYKSRKLPYNDDSQPKMILSVDLKTGEVDCTFRGSQFKINQFFKQGEEIETHIFEW